MSRSHLLHGRKFRSVLPDSYPVVIYPFAATQKAKPEAADYLEYLQSSAAKDIFDKYGFTFLVRPTS